MCRMPRIFSFLSVALLSPLLGAASALGAGPGSLAPSQAVERAQPRPADKLWSGPDGEPLPFNGHQEAVEFLRAATVIDTEEIGGSQNRPLRVLLEKDGVRMGPESDTWEPCGSSSLTAGATRLNL